MDDEIERLLVEQTQVKASLRHIVRPGIMLPLKGTFAGQSTEVPTILAIKGPDDTTVFA
jgi:hypothetical protein